MIFLEAAEDVWGDYYVCTFIIRGASPFHLVLQFFSPDMQGIGVDISQNVTSEYQNLTGENRFSEISDDQNRILEFFIFCDLNALYFPK